MTKESTTEEVVSTSVSLDIALRTLDPSWFLIVIPPPGACFWELLV
jgi:hypothetical protein